MIQNLSERFYSQMYLIRHTEEEIIRLYPTDKIKSPVHLSIGQEFVSVGVCEALQESDIVFGTYRGHALYLAKGGNLDEMVAELYGKETGCARGKGGSMHLVDPTVGMMGTSAVVATSIPHAAGYAYALKTSGKQDVVICFFGDGATEEGVFYETMNFAALKNLPIVFVCENNAYAIYTRIEDRMAVTDLCPRVATFGLKTERVTSGNILDVYDATVRAVESARTLQGPVFLEVDTYRWFDHVGPTRDWGLAKRSQEEAQKWFKSDPLKTIGDSLDDLTRKRLENDVQERVAKAIAFAESSAFPAAQELYQHVFCV
jgi:TPP-dependent pyruvate/acetoin dehydrogenase alpha subunit